MLAANNLTKIYPNGDGVKDLSFEVPDGVIVGLLGPNGAGKTTTIRLLSGLIKPDNGSATIDNILTYNNPDVRSKIAVLTDNNGVYENMTPLSYFSFFAKLYNLPKEQFYLNLESLSSSLNFNYKVNKVLGVLSKGNRQKALLIRVLLHNPKHIILDEPHSNLDPEIVFSLRELLKQRAKNGSAVLLSTHILEEAHKICDQIVLLNKGICVDQQSVSAIESIDQYYQDKMLGRR
ncbi:ATP-binding cassette domain-containing protein [Alicyclobacillus sp. TC]|uniref:ABC-2 type transport system ATP-binding protein n=1 Tax=Alicyclobacillus tolerans TaxID=90970 RepID=A0ABT9LZ63_9BACL|nr:MULTISPECIES: ATP-binding cassette domain-containing protein [Alicyclobacillus]MDP9729559.1 ABC-2 type transport system ATP-binding protein [Alicyclobacillus tengchongensis]QRF23539.1 ATP-binding cassette domain-containing protein [Alicyclobacillus sp. TC]